MSLYFPLNAEEPKGLNILNAHLAKTGTSCLCALINILGISKISPSQFQVEYFPSLSLEKCIKICNRRRHVPEGQSATAWPWLPLLLARWRGGRCWRLSWTDSGGSSCGMSCAPVNIYNRWWQASNLLTMMRSVAPSPVWAPGDMPGNVKRQEQVSVAQVTDRNLGRQMGWYCQFWGI